MIITLKPEVNAAKAEELGKELQAFVIKENGNYTLITPNKLKKLEDKYSPLVSDSVAFDDDIQLASRKYRSEVRTVKISDKISIGGKTANTVMIAGPCSVESEEQIEQAAQLCVKLGIGV